MPRTGSLALISALLALALPAAPAPASEVCEPAATPASGSVEQSKAATLLFLPGPVSTPEPELTAQLEQLPGFGVGLFSPTIGRYSPTQMLLDISQGSRVAGSLYKPVVAPPPGFAADGLGLNASSGRFVQWPGLVRRAEVVPGDVEPGLLACTVSRAGRRSVWIAPQGAATLTGIPAADAHGRVRSLVFPKESQLEAELIKAQKYADYVAGTLPGGSRGLDLVRALATADPDRLLIVVQTPPDPARTRLLSIAVRGVGSDGSITSATTRREGLVATTDIAPTILQRLDVSIPGAMQGQPIEGAGELSSEQLLAMNARLALVASRRGALGRDVLLMGGLIILLALLAGRLARRYDAVALTTRRVAALAIFWLPTLLLLTAVLRPSRATEANVVVAGSFLLAVGSDRLLRWPRAPLLPAIAMVLAHAVDFLFFSAQFTGESLLGSNPLYGARFFGIGNELETVIVVSCVIGVGAALCDRSLDHPARWFAGAAVVLALFLGAGRLGADVGGVIYVGAAFGAAAIYVAKVRLTAMRVGLLAGLVLVGLAAIAALDALTGGESHLTRTVVDAGGVGELWDVAVRRTSASINGAKTGWVWVAVLGALVALLVGWVRRERLLAPLTSDAVDPLLRRPYRAGLAGALVGTIVGALANDSGPAILIIGTIYIGMGVLYARAEPQATPTR